MKNIIQKNGLLTIINRLPSSINGNARFLISIDGLVCQTAIDSDLSDYVKNLDNRLVEATIGIHYGKETLNTLQAKAI